MRGQINKQPYTVLIDPCLLEWARAEAVERGETCSMVIRDALRRAKSLSENRKRKQETA